MRIGIRARQNLDRVSRKRHFFGTFEEIEE